MEGGSGADFSPESCWARDRVARVVLAIAVPSCRKRRRETMRPPAGIEFELYRGEPDRQFQNGMVDTVLAPSLRRSEPRLYRGPWNWRSGSPLYNSNSIPAGGLM